MRLLRLYPRRWRERYEAELEAVLEEHRVGWATLADLLVGAMDARLDRELNAQEEARAMSGVRRKNIRCSFCGKGADQVRRLIAGPGIYICDACIALCNDIIGKETAEAADGNGAGAQS